MHSYFASRVRQGHIHARPDICLDYEVLANALSQATSMCIAQEEVDDAMLHILNDADSTIAETNSIANLPPIEVPKFVSMTEFLILMVS